MIKKYPCVFLPFPVGFIRKIPCKQGEIDVLLPVLERESTGLETTLTFLCSNVQDMILEQREQVQQGEREDLPFCISPPYTFLKIYRPI